jgi:hypothetical protein
MNVYENYPIYYEALKLSTYFDLVVCNFAKRHKYNAGNKLLNTSLDVLTLVVLAIKRKTERKEHISKTIEKLEIIKAILHHCKEVKAFNSFHSFEVATKKTIAVAKQCEGWLKCQNSSSGKP